MKRLLPLLGLILVGCASEPEYRGSRGAEANGVIIERVYVPVRHVKPQEWGQHLFVPGYARQGVIVGASRTWTYGQGNGWRGIHEGARLATLEQMTGARTIAPEAPPLGDLGPQAQMGSGASRGPLPDPLSRGARERLGHRFSPYGARERILAQPLLPIEARRLQAYKDSGMNKADALAAVLQERWGAVESLRPLMAGEKGGDWQMGAPDPAPDATGEAPPPDGQVSENTEDLIP